MSESAFGEYKSSGAKKCKVILTNYNDQSGGNGRSTYFFRRKRVKVCIFLIPPPPYRHISEGGKTDIAFIPYEKHLDLLLQAINLTAERKEIHTFSEKKGI